MPRRGKEKTDELMVVLDRIVKTALNG